MSWKLNRQRIRNKSDKLESVNFFRSSGWSWQFSQEQEIRSLRRTGEQEIRRWALWTCLNCWSAPSAWSSWVTRTRCSHVSTHSAPSASRWDNVKPSNSATLKVCDSWIKFTLQSLSPCFYFSRSHKSDCAPACNTLATGIKAGFCLI